MASINEGLEVGGQVVDPSTDAGFAAVLESRGVKPDPEGERTPSRNVHEGLSTAQESGTPGRDPSGRFVSNQEAAAEGQSQQATGSSNGETSSDDPLVAEYLARHGGDLDAALREAAHAQSLVGRQAQETGATRQENQELRERLAKMEGILQTMQATPAAPALTPDQVESTSQTLTAQLGYQGAALNAINELGNESVYESVLRDWLADDPISAQRFDLDYQLWKRDAQAAQAAPAAAQPSGWLSQAENEAKVNALAAGFAALEQSYGGKEGFAPVLAQMEAAMEQMPPNVLAMVDSLDPEARQNGLSIVADRAARLAAMAGAAPVTPGRPSAEEQQAVVARKLGATVASSAARPAPAATTPDDPKTVAEAIANFKRDLVATETTSVREGLTYGAPLPGYAPRQ